MNLHTALRDVRRMIAADRLAVAAGLPAAALRNNAGYAVAEEIKRRWTATRSTTMNAGGAIEVMDRPIDGFPRQTRRRCSRLRLPANRFRREVPAP